MLASENIHPHYSLHLSGFVSPDSEKLCRVRTSGICVGTGTSPLLHLKANTGALRNSSPSLHPCFLLPHEQPLFPVMQNKEPLPTPKYSCSPGRLADQRPFSFFGGRASHLAKPCLIKASSGAVTATPAFGLRQRCERSSWLGKGVHGDQDSSRLDTQRKLEAFSS